MSRRRRLRIARTILVGLVLLAVSVGLIAELVTTDETPRPTPDFADLQPDEGGPRLSTVATPINEGELMAMPQHGRIGSIPGEWSYAVTVERGMPGGEAFGDFVDRILADPRGWSQRVRFRRARVGEIPTFNILLVSPANVDRLCQPLKTDGTYSCGLDSRAVINALRWRDGPVETAKAAWAEESQDSYRTMVVNHEVGHVLGLGHQTCKAPGSPSSVMAQQTIDLKGCTPNPWPTDEDLQRLR